MESYVYALIQKTHGEASALALATAFGGTVVSLPAAATPTHPIAAACGLQVLQTLVDYRGGEKLYIPLGPASARRRQRDALAAAIDSGDSPTVICRRLGVSRSEVYRMRRRCSNTTATVTAARVARALCLQQQGVAMAPTTFADHLAIVFDREGGIADRSYADDPGGMTNYGISSRSHPEAWHDGPPSREAAAAIFRRDYWDPIRGDDLPWPLSLFVFECSVMSGPSRAVRDLQEACAVRVDGAIGPVTLAAAQRLACDDERMAKMLADRALWLEGLSNWRANRRGWLKRLFKDALVAGRSLGERADPLGTSQ